MHTKTWKGYQKGVNLGGWFSQCDYSEDRFNNFITEDDFKELTSWGLGKITDMKLGLKEKIAMKELLKAVEGTDVEKLLREHGAI